MALCPCCRSWPFRGRRDAAILGSAGIKHKPIFSFSQSDESFKTLSRLFQDAKRFFGVASPIGEALSKILQKVLCCCDSFAAFEDVS